ncbi:MAG TPA: hypothetical protein VME45_06820 [Stellaceae bacterium]|nr:hypothetical protein [Stellaceae bacterium]
METNGSHAVAHRQKASLALFVPVSRHRQLTFTLAKHASPLALFETD